MSYYTCILVLSLAALAALGLLVWENNRLSYEGKRLLYITYGLIAAAFLAEWCGIQLDGNAEANRSLLIAAKCVDYILTPMTGGVLAVQMGMRGALRRFLYAMLAANAVFQIIACFFSWMIVVDENNHYTHGPLYSLYLVLCLMIILLVMIQAIIYGKSFKRKNNRSLYSIFLLIILGIFMQEFLPEGPRTEYIALTYGAALLFIHFEEFSSLAMDDKVLSQRIKLDTDALTGVYSRYAYSHALKKLDAAGLPPGLVAIAVDVNGLKEVNDNYGHEAGDELIRAAADCIKKVISRGDKCYRTGGDEFVVLARMNKEQAEWTLVSLESEAAYRNVEVTGELSLAAGYAISDDYRDCSAERLVREADKAMYEAKEEYYRKSVKDRRRR